MRLLASLFTLLLIVLAEARADNAVGANGLLVALPNPLTSDDVTRIIKRVEEARSKGATRPSTIVFDFTPNDKDVAQTAFGPCFDLADEIAKLHDLNTVAFLRKKVTGHLVLPLLACKEVVMADGAAFGEVIAAGGEALGPAVAGNYVNLLQTIRPTQIALIRKTYDASVRILRADDKMGGERYLDARDRAAAEKEGLINFRPESLPEIALYNTDLAVKYGFCKARAADRAELAGKYGLSPASLRDDPISDRAPSAFRLTLSGKVDQSMKESVARTLRDVVRQKGNLLFLHIECGGGDMTAARALADEIITVTRRTGAEAVKVVAVIPDRARDTATVVALGCSEIVMSRRKDAASGGENPAEAEIGDFEEYLKGEKNKDAALGAVRDLAEKQGIPTILIEGMFRKELEIYRVRGKVDRTKRMLMSRAEYEEKKADWVSEGVVKAPGQLLKLNATQAEQVGIARLVVDSRDPNEVYEKYGVAGKVKEATPAWLDRFAAYLRYPAVTVILVVIGFLGLLLELKVPGTTIPGIMSALSFILVFWAHTQFSGQVVVLSGLLFLLGLVLILMEVFVFPGFGAAGIFGILLMLGSLGLVTVEQIPETGEQWLRFGSKMAQYMFGLIAAAFGAFFLARYLPRMPLARQMALAAPDEQEAEEGGAALLPGAAQAAGLLGAIGVAATVLRPAGTVRFGDDFIDVVTEGGYIAAGTRVQVVEVEGTRIVVKEV